MYVPDIHMPLQQIPCPVFTNMHAQGAKRRIQQRIVRFACCIFESRTGDDVQRFLLVIGSSHGAYIGRSSVERPMGDSSLQRSGGVGKAILSPGWMVISILSYNMEHNL